MTRQFGFWMLPVMIIAVAWGFIGVFGSMGVFMSGNPQLAMIMFGTGLLGWCVPAIVEFIEEGSVDLRPRFMK